MTPEQLDQLIDEIMSSSRQVFTRERTFADWAVFVRDALREAIETNEEQNND